MKNILFILGTLIVGCAPRKLPPPAATQTPVQIRGAFSGDTLLLSAENPSPVSFVLRLHSNREEFQGLLPEAPLVLDAHATRTIALSPVVGEEDRAAIGPSLLFRTLLDTTAIRPDSRVRYQYPFPTGKSYTIMQGYEGMVSHNQPTSRYAIDFALGVGDTVCAARDGLVIERVAQNTLHGTDRSYEAYANYLTLYHADGVITQYVHLAPGGILVAVGDSVRAGQPIGIVGMTGFTTAPHLHFNACIGLSDQRRSIPIRFIDRAGAELRPGDRVQR